MRHAVHNEKSFSEDSKSAAHYVRITGEQRVAWVVREPGDRNLPQYGFTSRLEAEILCPALLVVGEKAEYPVFPGDILMFEPSEIPIQVLRWDYDY